MHPAVIILAVAFWLFILYVLHRADLRFWKFLWGSIGSFILLMVFVRPYVTMPLSQMVTALSGVVGSVTDTFDAYFKYAIIYVPTADSSITLQIDMECSGVIEIMAFVSLLAFFNVYDRFEKVAVGIGSVLLIMLFNALRIVIICEIVHFFGVDAYGIAHTYIGRIVFYALTVLMYFYVFTRSQVIRMKVGEFRYDHGTDGA